jgi:hypothetical protein
MRTQRKAWQATTAAAVVLTAVCAASLAAQNAPGSNAQASPAAVESLDRTFPFVGNQLRVTISGPAAGTLRVARGDLGEVGVVARATGGVPAAALDQSTGQSEMTLDSGPATRVDYVLTLPGDARLDVRLAGRPAASLSPIEQNGGWSWPAQAAAPLQPLPQ